MGIPLIDILLRRFRQLDRRIAGREEDDSVAGRHDRAVLVLDPDIQMHLVPAIFLHLPADLAFDPIGIAGVDELAVLARHFPQPAVVAHPVGAEVVRKVSRSPPRSEEHTSELQSLMRISYAVFCLKKKTK